MAKIGKRITLTAEYHKHEPQKNVRGEMSALHKKERFISMANEQRRSVTIHVTVPRLEIFDARGEAIQEKFYEVGSSIDLRCNAFHVPRDAVVWSRGGAVVYHSPETGIR
ncbi:hypothetical protein E2C01_070631 [Portunus trituberculatus]|uniref:Ig-like domain-containing protein n=1 Tax=Portunus trituberculatus TaxID=210409 RepID=A0A5B7I5Y5_PORTR|nr:hypothetical protein [Portunus trituberculatus]